MGARRTQTIGNVAGQEEHDRGQGEARLAGFVGDEGGAADLDGGQAQRDAQVDDHRAPPRLAQWPHRHDATVTSAERTVIRTAVERPPPRGTRKRRLPADDTGGRDP